MNLSEIYTMSRLNTGTNDSNMPDATLLTITNVTYRDLINVITSEVNEDFFYQEWIDDFTAWQREYPFPVRTTWVDGLKKLISVGIKYATTDDYFRMTEPSKFSNLTKDATYYETNLSNSTPFFTVADKSVFIYPLATTTITDWILLYWISDPCELTAWAAESAIKIPLDYHHLIVLGNEYRIYKARRMTNEKNDAIVEYKNELRKMVTELSDRIIKPLESKLPYLTNLE